MQDDLILAFDTSAAHCAAAVLGAGAILAAGQEDMGKGQAERLFPMLEELLQVAGIGWRDLGAIGVGIGPGNFTGVRISVAAARGLALSLKIPAIGVSVLEAQGEGLAGPVISSLDARRGSIYLQILGNDEKNPPVLCDLASLPSLADLTAPACVGHEAAAIAALCGGHVAVAPLPVAVAIARIAARRRHLPQDRPAPLYLRPADAAPARDAPPVILP